MTCCFHFLQQYHDVPPAVSRSNTGLATCGMAGIFQGLVHLQEVFGTTCFVTTVCTWHKYVRRVDGCGRRVRGRHNPPNEYTCGKRIVRNVLRFVSISYHLQNIVRHTCRQFVFHGLHCFAVAPSEY